MNIKVDENNIIPFFKQTNGLRKKDLTFLSCLAFILLISILFALNNTERIIFCVVNSIFLFFFVLIFFKKSKPIARQSYLTGIIHNSLTFSFATLLYILLFNSRRTIVLGAVYLAVLIEELIWIILVLKKIKNGDYKKTARNGKSILLIAIFLLLCVVITILCVSSVADYENYVLIFGLFIFEIICSTGSVFIFKGYMCTKYNM